MLHSILPPRDVEKLVIAFARARNSTEVSEAEMQKILDWATEAKCAWDLLTCVLNGMLLIDLQDGQVAFPNPVPKEKMN